MGNSRFALLACKNINYLKLRQSRNLLRGNSTRSTGTRGANEESSRSHAILQLCIKGSADGTKSKPARLVGKLSFIDLAGSERGADTTDNDKQTRWDFVFIFDHIFS